MLLSSLTNSAQSDDILTVSAPPSAMPYAWTEGEHIVGASVDLIKIIFADFGITVKTQPFPWKRSLSFIEEGKIDAVLIIFYSEERSKYMDFTIPYSEMATSVIVAKGSALKFKEWDDLIGLQGVCILGYSLGEDFDKFAEEKLSLISLPEMEKFLNVIAGSRADYGVFPKDSALIEARKLKYLDKIEILPVPVSAQNLHIAFSKKSKFKKYLPEINNKIKMYREDKTIENLIKKAIVAAADK